MSGRALSETVAARLSVSSGLVMATACVTPGLAWSASLAVTEKSAVNVLVLLSLVLVAGALGLMGGTRRQTFIWWRERILNGLLLGNVLLIFAVWGARLAVAMRWSVPPDVLGPDWLGDIPSFYELGLISGLCCASLLLARRFTQLGDAMLHALLGLSLLFVVLPLVISLWSPLTTGFRLSTFGVERWVLAVSGGLSVLTYILWRARHVQWFGDKGKEVWRSLVVATAFMVMLAILPVIFGGVILHNFDLNRQKHIESLLNLRADLIETAFVVADGIARTAAHSPDVIHLLGEFHQPSPVESRVLKLRALLQEMVRHRVLYVAVYDKNRRLLSSSGEAPDNGHSNEFGKFRRFLSWNKRLVMRQWVPIEGPLGEMGTMLLDIHLPEVAARLSEPERTVNGLMIALCSGEHISDQSCLTTPYPQQPLSSARAIGPGSPVWPTIDAARRGGLVSIYRMSAIGPVLVTTTAPQASGVMLVGLVDYDSLRRPLAETLLLLILALSLLIIFAALVVRFPFRSE